LKYTFILYCLLFSSSLFAQPEPRREILINNGWSFLKNDSSAHSTNWEQVTIPHTWNIEDVMDDVPGYYRGVGVYKRQLQIDNTLNGKQLFLFFEGVNQVAEIFVNGKKAGNHVGGYAAFSVDITPFIKPGNGNEIIVKVDNRYNADIPPLSADFSFFGGIYRDVLLIAVETVHFSLNDFGSKGVFIITPSVTRSSASVVVKTTLTNKLHDKQKIKIVSSVTNKKGKKVGAAFSVQTVEQGADQSFSNTVIKIKDPHLWSPESPYLYTVTTEIRDAVSNRLLDIIKNPLGLRWFRFDSKNGFFLNDKPYKLIGSSRHQDYKGMGNAVPKKFATRDVELIKEMGGNFLRVAHYPQDPAILEACDRLGILASVEIPIVNEITESESFYNNCEDMQVEMIRQHFNHPSVIMWCYMNEVLLKPHYNDNKEKQKIYYANIARLAKRLDSITRKEDPFRYTMMAHHGDFIRYKEVGLIDIPMLVGWNLYSGWYGGDMSGFPAFLDQFHKAYPDKPMMVTEYGADADPRIRSNEPVRFDKSVEYATSFHQYYLDAMLRRPFVAAAMIWNLADFNSETREESMPHINNKGLLEWDRTPKDPYYYYKAMLQKTPFVKILGSSIRGAIADSATDISTQIIQVASNMEENNLMVNGKLFGNKKPNNGMVEWRIPLNNGINYIEIKARRKGEVLSDKKIIECSIAAYSLSASEDSFSQINILLGAKRSFINKDNELWQPDQVYRKGSWGHVGGKPFKLINNNRLPYGTDKNIKGTDDDPVYQTQQVGIEKYKIDAPKGEYELTLHFSELLGGTVKGLDYNLDSEDRIEPSGKRIFDVFVNNKMMLENFNITGQYGAASSVSKVVRLSVKDNNGIEIVFKPVEGDPILNALQLKRIIPNNQHEQTAIQ